MNIIQTIIHTVYDNSFSRKTVPYFCECFIQLVVVLLSVLLQFISIFISSYETTKTVVASLPYIFYWCKLFCCIFFLSPWFCLIPGFQCFIKLLISKYKVSRRKHNGFSPFKKIYLSYIFNLIS